MAQHVTTFGGGPIKDRRLTAMTDRFGGDRGEIRGASSRDADAMFQWFRAARSRYRIGRVVRHVCHHDQGIGTCTDSVVEG